MIQLDVLRGIAILLVLFTHSTIQPVDSGAFIGYFSYPIYLWHINVTRLVAPLFKLGTGVSLELRWVVSFALYVCVATAAGVVAAAIVDEPSLRVRERLFPSRTTLPIVAKDAASAAADA